MKKQHCLILQREYAEQGTNGRIYFQDRFICYTIELPWRNNKRRRSCIPEGRYRLYKQQYARHGEQIGLLAVPGRDAILIHAANHAERELLGCIAPVSRLLGAGRGLESQKALSELKALVYSLWDMGAEVYLEIHGAELEVELVDNLITDSGGVKNKIAIL